MATLQVHMLGEFSLTWETQRISDAGNRTRKSWNLLAYLICHRNRVISQRRLIEVLWGEDSDNLNPENTLRITLHRARAMLDNLFPGAGHALILHREGGYTWSDAVPMEVDSDRFSALCEGKVDLPRLEALMEAVQLHQGDFLEKQSSESWVIPIATHIHNLYIAAVMEAGQLLGSQGRHKEAAAICQAALPSEPYHEPLHQLLMQALAAAGDRRGAGAVYDGLSKRLFDDFGIRPGEQTRAVYRACAHTPTDQSLPLDVVLEQLQEPQLRPGALECDYDYFKILCYNESRGMERSGNATHILLLSLASPPGKPLTRRSMERIMQQLGEQIRINLRRGDVFSRCSVSQFIVMLPKANYENSCMVCRRVLGAFRRAHPHVTAQVHYMVQPLTPSISVP